MIYVISNVEYPESRKIRPNKDDLLVFLNKATSLDYYKDHENKIIFRRMNSKEYGTTGDGIEKKYVFGKAPDPVIPRSFIDSLKKEYNWDYDIEKGKAKSATTGFMVVKYLEKEYPDQKIILVNFGYDLKKSTYRCPWHNWKYENEQLAYFAHMYTAQVAEKPVIEVVYGCDENYLDKVHMSAKTVLANNPNAHITILSEVPLKTHYTNVIVDTSGYKFRTRGRLTKAAYLRLFIPECLPYNKVIYLDGDCICRGSLEELWDMDIPYIGVCHSHDAGTRQAEEIGIPWYGMSSLMVMNLPALKSINFTKFAMYAMEHFKFPKTSWYCDETILNCCFHDRLKKLHTKWCYCINRSYEKYGEKVTSNEANVIHFIGGQHELFKEFFDKKKY